MTKIFIYKLIVLFVFCNSFVMASSFNGGGRGLESGLFFGADLNRDEGIRKDEARALYNLSEDDIFSRYDEDESGFITRLEFKEYFQQKPWLDKFIHPKDR